MSAVLQSRSALPGIRFESRAPERRDVLPRMDVAAFVGFAASGPLDIPVPVEDVPAFRDLFGPDPVLARNDADRGHQRALLGPAVEDFFRHGGRRCWVVRIAGDTAATSGFPVPGVTGVGGATPLLRARSPGAWADGLRVAGGLERTRLALQPLAQPLRFHPGGTGPVTTRPATVWLAEAEPPRRAGDLLELHWLELGLALWAFAEPSDTAPTGAGAEPPWRLAHPTWIALGDDTGIDPGSPALAPGERQELTAAAAALRLTPWLADPAAPPPRISLLTLALRLETLGDPAEAGDMDEAFGRWRLGGLAFDSRHPRCFDTLPDDDALFALPQGRAEPILPAARVRLLAEVASPRRFPLAGPYRYQDLQLPERRWLPLDLPDAAASLGGAAAAAWGRALDRDPDTRALRDGLERLDPLRFVDPALSRFGVRALRAEADHAYYVRGRRLRGVHALLPVSEATLVAMPDLAQRAWAQLAPPPARRLVAPILTSPGLRPEAAAAPGATAADGCIQLDWSAVPMADAYQLQRQLSPSPVDEPADRWQTMALVDSTLDDRDRPAAVVHRCVAATPGCAGLDRFRVRAMAGGQPGPWSNSLVVVHGPADFQDCARPPFLPLLLSAGPAMRPDAVRLEWRTSDGRDLPGGTRVEVQESIGLDFAAPRSIFAEGAGASPPETWIERQRPEDAPRYYRARAGAAQPWSNTLAVEADSLSDRTLIPDTAAHAEARVRVQRALLRFCAARADLFAVLSLPRGYRAGPAVTHLAALRAPGSALAPGGEMTAAALSFGALYHPWLMVMDGDGAALVTPPDGAVTGLMAALALGEGAWIPPANLTLSGPVGLEPALSMTEQQTLAGAGIDLVWQRPRGFTLSGVATLQPLGEVPEVQIRRLLILLRRLALREGNLHLFEPNDHALRARVRLVFERLLDDLYRRGAFGGATPADGYRLVLPAGPAVELDAERGRLVVELRILPARAVIRIRVRLVLQGPGQVTLEEL